MSNSCCWGPWRQFAITASMPACDLNFIGFINGQQTQRLTPANPRLYPIALPTLKLLVCLPGSALIVFADSLDFVVNGTAIPHTDFDIGESYAGLLPIGGDSDGELYFWFFPTTDVNASKDIIIWLNGGVSMLLKANATKLLITENSPVVRLCKAS